MSTPIQFLEILRILQTAEIRYVIIGGLAMRLHGSAHVTDDIDIVYARDEENLVKLAAALKPYHPSLYGADLGLPFILDRITFKNTLNLTLQTDIGRIDLLGSPAGINGFDDLWDKSVEVSLYDITIRIASLEDIIRMKRAANRPKDQLHLLELEAIQKIVKGQEDSPQS